MSLVPWATPLCARRSDETRASPPRCRQFSPARRCAPCTSCRPRPSPVSNVRESILPLCVSPHVELERVLDESSVRPTEACAGRAAKDGSVRLADYFVIASDASLPTSSLVRIKNELETRVKFTVLASTA